MIRLYRYHRIFRRDSAASVEANQSNSGPSSVLSKTLEMSHSFVAGMGDAINKRREGGSVSSSYNTSKSQPGNCSYHLGADSVCHRTPMTHETQPNRSVNTVENTGFFSDNDIINNCIFEKGPWIVTSSI